MQQANIHKRQPTHAWRMFNRATAPPRLIGAMHHSKASNKLHVMLCFPESRIPNPESRIPNPESRFPIPDSRFPNPESRFPIPDSRFPRCERRHTSCHVCKV